MTPGQLSEELKRPISTISGHLSILRSLDILRFETSGENVWYWIKHEEIVEVIRLAMECVVNIQMEK